MKSYKARYARFKALNPRIIASRNRRWVGLIVKTLLSMGVIAAIAVVFLKNQPALLPVGIAAAVGLPLWRIKPWQRFKSGWVGVIEAHEFEESYENVDKKLINPRYNGRHYVTYIHFNARDEQGRKRTFKLDRKYEEVYQIGDAVMRIPGLDYPVDLTVQDKTVCPLCGAIYPSTNERCVTVGCGMPAIELDSPEP